MTINITNWVYLQDKERLAALLPYEAEILSKDKDFYLECLNNKVLAKRKTEQEIRDGLILFGMVYCHCRDIEIQNKPWQFWLFS